MPIDISNAGYVLEGIHVSPAERTRARELVRFTAMRRAVDEEASVWSWIPRSFP
jgi:hypothetical protein